MARYLTVRIGSPPAWAGAALLAVGVVLAPGAWSDAEEDAAIGDVPTAPAQITVTGGQATALNGPITLRDLSGDHDGALWRLVAEDGQLEIAGDITATAGTGIPRLLVLRAGR